MTRPSRLTIALAMAAVVACGPATEDDSPQASGRQTRVERIQDWEFVRDSLAVPIESPARMQQHERAFIVPAGSSQRIPVKSLPVFLYLVALTDYTCAECRVTDSVMAVWANRYLAIRSIVHLPRSDDQRSMEAARAFECADEDGQGREMHAALYAAQSDLGKRSWASIADEAMVEDTMVFKRCMEEHPDRRIQAGLALAARFNVKQLPAAIVNGWVIVPATPERLREAVSKMVDREIR